MGFIDQKMRTGYKSLEYSFIFDESYDESYDQFFIVARR
jgi:hypothetical protein